MTDQLIEQLAAIEHERWASWQRYLHSLCLPGADGSLFIPAGSVKHWERQIATPYVDLSEREKESDREQVRRYLPLFEARDRALIAEVDALRPLRAAALRYGQALAEFQRDERMTIDEIVRREGTWSAVDRTTTALSVAKRALDALALALATEEGPR